MKIVLQRVAGAKVTVEGKISGEIGKGVLILLGVHGNDTQAEADFLADKCADLRIFNDENGKMNRSLCDIGGDALVVSQFTLYGDVRRGKRPSFTTAMEPGEAEKMYERFVALLERLGVPCSKGVFAAMMDVESVNDGPVTILLDSTKLF